MVIPAVFALYRAYGEMRATDALAQQGLLLAEGQALMPQHAPLSQPASPNAILTDALMRARVAHDMERANPDRTLLLNEAERQLRGIERARPKWGAYWAVRAYISALRDGERAPATVAQISRSWRETPYLRQSAEWRTGYMMRNWDLLPADAQTIAVREAVWLARSDYDQLDRVMAWVRESDAYRPFMREWLSTRELDNDFTPVQGLTPQ